MKQGHLKEHGALRALRQPSFRWYIAGRLAGSSTGSLRGIAQGWLAYQLTGSLLALGGIGGLRSAVMMIAAPIAGVASDRMDRRRIMIAARLALTIINGGLGVLALTGNLAFWHLVVGAILEGLALAAKDPAEQAILADLVSHGALASAISTTSVFEGLMGMLASAGAGLLLEYVGPASLFFALAVLFAICGFTYLYLPVSTGDGRRDRGLAGDVLAATRYLRTEPLLMLLLAVGFFRILLIQPYQDFLPALAEDRFAMGPSGLGLLQTAAGAARLVSSMMIASLGYVSQQRERQAALYAGAVAGLGLLLLAAIPLLPLPYLFVFLIAGASNTANVMVRSALQVTCDPGYRGRISSLSVMTMHLARMGALPAGALADGVGAVPVLAGSGLLAIVVHLAIDAIWRHRVGSRQAA